MPANKLSDKLVFNILAGINIGYLEIMNCQGDVFKFGNPQDNLKAQLKIKKPNFSFNLIKGGSIGLAESYIRGEFETKDEFKDRVNSEEKLILNEGWKEKIYVTASNVYPDYDIDTQQMSFPMYGFPDIEFEEYSSCDTPYRLEFEATVDNKTYGSFSPKRSYRSSGKELTYTKKMDRKAAQLLKENSRTISYTGVKLNSAIYAFDRRVRRGIHTGNEWYDEESMRRFSGEIKYIILINSMDGSLVASYFSQDYINNYLSNDIALLSVLLGVDPINDGGKEDFASLLHKKAIENSY